jgi:hypothetical protein
MLEDSVIDERGHINGSALQAIGRMAGDWYTSTVNGNFEIARPIISAKELINIKSYLKYKVYIVLIGLIIFLHLQTKS